MLRHIRLIGSIGLDFGVQDYLREPLVAQSPNKSRGK